MPRARLISLVVVGLLAGCGSGSKTLTITGSPGSSLAPAHPAERAVIKAWTDALRRGDIRTASSQFALPSFIENGPAVILRTRSQVRGFNESLPCGSRLVSAQRFRRYTVATFVLTSRPGGACGTGVGATARVAFVIRHGRIEQWLRVTSYRDLLNPRSLPRPAPAQPDLPPAVTGPTV